MTVAQGASHLAPDPPAPVEFRRGLVAISPVLLGMVPFALVLGAEAAKKGLSVFEVALMCGLNFAGGSEFVAIELWQTPPQLMLIAAMTLLVNSRHLLMGAALAAHLRHLPTHQICLALFFMADEIWAFGLDDARRREAVGIRPSLSLPFYAGLAAGLYVSWVIVTAFGALVGPMIDDPAAYGFDMAFTAVFLVLIKGQWRGYRAAMPWLASLAAAVVTHQLVPGSWYVAAGALSGLAAAYLDSGRRS